jgi:serine O-acetyltransferase
MRLKELILSDLDRFAQTYRLRDQPYSKSKVFWESFLFKAGFQAVFLYRISHWLYHKGWIYPAWFLTRFNITLTGAEIEFNAQIGPGMFIAHPVGIVIGRGTVIGSGVTIFQGVSLVAKSWHPDNIRKFPKIGNNCCFFANCIVLGDVTIGHHCVVAAHSVVTRDLVDGSLAKGVPAKSYPNKGSEILSSWGVKPLLVILSEKQRDVVN